LNWLCCVDLRIQELEIDEPAVDASSLGTKRKHPGNDEQAVKRNSVQAITKSISWTPEMVNDYFGK
jgi:hypothetical protein